MKYKLMTSLALASLAAAASAVTPTPQLFGRSFQPFAFEAQQDVVNAQADAKPPSNWAFALGASVNYLPRYLGSNRQRILPLPIIDVIYKRRYFLTTEEGLGVNLYNHGQDKVGVALGYDLGRRERDDKKNLRGLGNIPAYGTADIFGQYAWHKVVAYAKVKTSLQMRRGLTIEANIGYQHKLTSKLNFFAGPSVMWASENYMSSYFSVNQKQSTQSGLARYSAHAGMLGVGPGFNLLYQATPSWLITAYGGGDYLFKKAGDSPITRRRWQQSSGIGVMYLF
jgi:MipA family protein